MRVQGHDRSKATHVLLINFTNVEKNVIQNFDPFQINNSDKKYLLVEIFLAPFFKATLYTPHIY